MEALPHSSWKELTLDETPLYSRNACSALVITCSDFRFKGIERRLSELAGLVDDYDLIARPGAIRSLVLPRNEAAASSMAEEISLLWRLHRFSRVLMVNHLSCRAYDDIASGEGEREIHVAHLGSAGPAIERLCPNVFAEAYLISLVNGVAEIEPLSRS